MRYELLIIDDEQFSRDTISTCFPWEQLGFHVAGQCSNGLEALQLMEKQKIHVILSDIRMPVVSGLDLARELAQRKSSPLLIFFSGYRDFEYARQAMVYGVRFYLVKPLKYEELQQTFSVVRQELDTVYGKDSPEKAVSQDDIIDKIRQYVITNYQTASLKEASERFYLNSSYLSQLYKQKTGGNFSDFVMEVRMKEAAGLLKNPAIKIYTIGNQVGYTNAKNFARSFRSYFGKSPKEYRESYLYEVYDEADR